MSTADPMGTDMNGLVDRYFALQQEVHAAFGYTEDWAVMPIDDARGYYWHLDVIRDGSGEVWLSTRRETMSEWVRDGDYGENGDDAYVHTIFTYRHLTRWVYRTGGGLTMVVVDTNTDGNRFLQIFDDAKEITGAERAQLHRSRCAPEETA